jgi:hypothetical protein
MSSITLDAKNIIACDQAHLPELTPATAGSRLPKSDEGKQHEHDGGNAHGHELPAHTLEIPGTRVLIALHCHG